MPHDDRYPLLLLFSGFFLEFPAQLFPLRTFPFETFRQLLPAFLACAEFAFQRRAFFLRFP